MKRIICSLAVVLGCISLSQAQVPLDVGGKQLNAGLGFGSWGLPVYAGLDFGMSDEITVGGEVGFSRFSENTGNFGEYDHTLFQIGARADYHLTMLIGLPSNIDVYAGASAGLAFFDTEVKSVGLEYQGDNTTGLYLGLQIGGRYFFSDDFGLNLQLGGGTFFTSRLGITYIL